jgi:hypothetical protein
MDWTTKISKQCLHHLTIQNRVAFDSMEKDEYEMSSRLHDRISHESSERCKKKIDERFLDHFKGNMTDDEFLGWIKKEEDLVDKIHKHHDLYEAVSKTHWDVLFRSSNGRIGTIGKDEHYRLSNIEFKQLVESGVTVKEYLKNLDDEKIRRIGPDLEKLNNWRLEIETAIKSVLNPHFEQEDVLEVFVSEFKSLQAAIPEIYPFI